MTVTFPATTLASPLQLARPSQELEGKPRAPIKCHGGKTYLRARIFSQAPRYFELFVDAFGGGGSMTLHRPRMVPELAHQPLIVNPHGGPVHGWLGGFAPEVKTLDQPLHGGLDVSHGFVGTRTC